MDMNGKKCANIGKLTFFMSAFFKKRKRTDFCTPLTLYLYFNMVYASILSSISSIISEASATSLLQGLLL